MKNLHQFIFIILCCIYGNVIGLSMVYFTPRDDLKKHILELIDQERLSIDCAMYMLTEKTIAQSILNAFLRGVKIRLILDQISMGEKYGKGLFLKNNGVSVAVFTPNTTGTFMIPIMHHKFFVFGYNVVHKKSLVWTGSYNCTASASRLHEENAVVMDDPMVVGQYKQCFIDLWNRLNVTRLVEMAQDEEGTLESVDIA